MTEIEKTPKVFVKFGNPVNSNRYVPYSAMRENLPPKEFEDPNSWTEVDGTMHPNQYIDKNLKRMVRYPDKPGDNYIFDYENQCWVEPVKTTEELWLDLRAKRDRLISATDWVVIRAQESGTEVPNAWLAYRQALRDITEQPGAPMNVQWPTKPDS